MLLVKTKTRQSDIHGLGLFAGQFIPKGTAVWKVTPGFDQRFTEEEILALPELLQTYLCKYAYRSKKSGLYIFAADDGKYVNHSDNPNCFSEYSDDEEEAVCVATVDIQIGEEITDDYNSFEEDIGKDSVLNLIAEKYKLADEQDPRLKHSI